MKYLEILDFIRIICAVVFVVALSLYIINFSEKSLQLFTLMIGSGFGYFVSKIAYDVIEIDIKKMF